MKMKVVVPSRGLCFLIGASGSLVVDGYSCRPLPGSLFSNSVLTVSVFSMALPAFCVVNFFFL